MESIEIVESTDNLETLRSSGRRKLSLNKKLILFAGVIAVPLMILTVYLISSLLNFSNNFNQIVKNITTANIFNLTFKDQIDYSTYQIFIGHASFETADETENLRNPYTLMEEMREALYTLHSTSKVSSNKNRITIMLNSLNNLEKNMDIIKENCESGETGLYDQNYVIYDYYVQYLTESIQKTLQEYIYYETANFEEIRADLETKAQHAVTISIFAFIVILVCIFVAVTIITQSVARPIKKLCEASDLVAQGDFSTRALTRTAESDEISVLTNSFNNMIGEIEHLVESIKQEQDNLRVTELKLLQAQINPHFLYNTLDSIIWLVEGNQRKQVISMVTSLSDFFRIVLSEGKDYITIREETMHIRSYLEIQKFRYRDILDFEINIEEEIYSYMILKLTLQPLVENALYHGIKNKRGVGRILVNGKKEGDTIILEVTDNGIGMSTEDLNRLMQQVKADSKMRKKGFGLGNVDERIRLNFGLEYGLHIESEEGKGTCVRVILPVVMQMPTS